MRLFTLIAFFSFLSGFCSVAYAQTVTTITLTDSTKGYDIATKVGQTKVEKKSVLTLDQISKLNFIVEERNILHLANNKGILWVKIPVQNQTPMLKWYLEIGSSLANIDIYIQNQQQTLSKIDLGYDKKFNERFLQTDRLLIPLHLETNQSYTIYIRVESDYFQAPLHIAPLEYYFERDHKIDIAEGIYYGFIIVMFFYNVFLFINLQEKGYLYYVIYLLGTGLATSQLRGHGFEFLWSDSPIVNQYVPFFHALSGGSAVLFLMNFLNTRKTSPFFNKILWLTFGAYAFAAVLALLGMKLYASVINQTGGGISPIFIIAFAIYIYYKGYRPAKYIIIAWTFYLIGVTLFVLAGAGMIEYNGFNSSAILFGSAIEMVLLSVALAAKIDMYKKEKQEVQKKLLQSAEENKRLVVEQNKILEEKVIERTEELNMVNEELSVNLERLNEQNLVIAKKNQDITSSINYAKRIQEAMLPKVSQIQKVIPDFFVFFQPRDIVSGDFYYFHQVGNKLIIAAVDCTGHGVPGAFMSLIGYDLLNQIVEDKDVQHAGTVLDYLDTGISKALRQDDTQIRDGMDAAICVIDIETNTIEFSGARNPLIYVQDNQLHVIKADRQSIGGNIGNVNKIQFSTHQLSLDESTTIYLFSDGFQDQFGGDTDKKYTIKKFRETLTQTAQLPFPEQESHLRREFESWRKGHAQIDDILVIGFKFIPKK